MSKLTDLTKLAKLRWNTPKEGRFLTLKEITHLSTGAIGYNFIVSLIGTLITVSQIPEIYNIGVIHGPIIFFIAGILGFITQPLMGKLLENKKSKFGKHKLILLLIAPFISVLTVAATWLPQQLDETARLIYAYCICTPTLVLWYLWTNLYNLLPAVVSPNQQERTDVWAPVSLIGGISPTIINFIKGFVRGYFVERGQEYLAYRYMGLISVVCGLILVIFIAKINERVYISDSGKEKVGLIEGLKLVTRNAPLMVLTLALVLGSMRISVEAELEILGKLRYAQTIDKGLMIFGSLTLVIGLAGSCNVVSLPFLTRKFSHKTLMIFWGFMSAAGYCTLAIVGVQNIAVGKASAIVITAMRFLTAFNAFLILQPLMLSELYDYQQFISGKRLEGFIQTFALTLVTISTNTGMLIMAFVKQAIGFEPKNYFNKMTVEQSLMDTATRYFNIAFLVAGISALAMTVVMFFYGMSKKKHEEIEKELQHRGSI